MRKKIIFLLTVNLAMFMLFLSGFSFAVAETGVVRGVVTDKKSKAKLPGITITVEGKDVVGFTDGSGNYSLELPEGTYTIRAELLGYKSAEAKEVVVLVGEENKINFAMEEIGVLKGEEVVVTGERMTIPISRATASVSMVTEKEFEMTAGADDAGAILKNTPGVQMESIGGAGTKKMIKIRGQGSPIDNNRVLLLIDGVPNQSPRVGTAELSDLPVEMIERIEVFKGAASSVYGGNAQSGVINVITKKGKKDPVFNFDSSVSTYQHRANANQDWTQYYSVYHSWAGENWDYTLSGSYLFSKGLTYAEKERLAVKPVKQQYASVNYPGFPGFDKNKPATALPFFNENINKVMDTGDLDDSENYNVTASLGFKPFKGNYFRVNAGYAFRHAPQLFGAQLVPPIVLVTNAKRDFLNFTDDFDITPRLKYSLKGNLQKYTDVGDMLFFSNNYITKKTAGELIKEGIPIEDAERTYVNPNEPPLHITPYRYFSRSWSIDNSLSYTSDIFEENGNNIVVGHSYRWEKVDLPPSKNLGLRQLLKTPLYRKFTSLYGQVVQKFGKLNVNVGGRWEQITGFIDDWDDEFSPRIAVNYELTPGTTLRASVGRAFRPPEYSHLYFYEGRGGNSYGNPDLKYETTWSYELGFKFLTKYLSGDIAYFYSDYSDTETEVPFLASNPGYVDLRNPDNLKYIKIFEKNREILGGATASAIDHVLDYWLKKGLTTKNRLINFPRSKTWISRGALAYQGFDTNFDISIPWAPNFALNLSYLFNRAVAGNPNPFDFSQGAKPKPVVTPNESGGKRNPVPIVLVEKGGDRLVDVPTHTFRLTPSYKFPSGLILSINGRYKSDSGYKSTYSPTGYIVQKEHWIWDLAAVQPLFNNKMKIKFAIENVFSKLYYEVGTIPSTVARYELGVSWSF